MRKFEEQLKQAWLRTSVAVGVGSLLLLGSSVVGADFGLAPVRVQASDRTEGAPVGWLLAGSKPASYRTGVDKTMVHDGQASVYLESAVPNTGGFGTVMQAIDAANYAGKRVRLRADVRSQDVGKWAGMWMRVDKGQEMGISFDNMQDRAIKGTQSWSGHDVVLDVPEDATSLSFGILLTGEGEVWASHFVLEVVGKDTEVTGSKLGARAPLSKTPVNLNFSE